ncbi:MAG: hypothetical protein MJY45_02270 [Bacteroidales bacterium]|nr:hypothetical protein [Bacteroidales bacterium]
MSLPVNKIFALVLAALLVPLFLGAQPDRRDVRSGNRDFRKQDYRNAEIDYRKAAVKDSLSSAAQYNLAASLYCQGNYEGAASAMSVIERNAEAVHTYPNAVIWKDSSADEGRRTLDSDFRYNAGDIALQRKDYGAAVKAFKESLLLNPDDLDAKENYIYAKKMLENQQNGGGQNQNQNQNQNQDQGQNQDQNQDQSQNQDRNQDRNRDSEPQPRESSISPQQAQQMLQAIQAREKETQDKVNREKAAALKARRKEKNW